MSSSDPTAEKRVKQLSRDKITASVAVFASSAGDAPVVGDFYWVPDVEQMNEARRQKPWRADPHFFNSVSVSLGAAMKMFIHATRGCPDMSQGRFNWFEVMGLLIGHFRDHELILTDSFSLPVAATEVECNMTEASQIYMANYLEYHRRLGKAEPGCVGWYHTHPGYSCFLSGIDVMTQQGSQRMQDPWVALVIDPVETLRTGQFSMKAFRTYPEGYTRLEAPGNVPGDAKNSFLLTSPHSGGNNGEASGSSFVLPSTSRIRDFGMHAHRYYELPVRVIQSSRDAPLWALLQQHFWPLSLSLTFPFAASTQICKCCSKDLTHLLAQLAELGGRERVAAASMPGLLSSAQRSGRYVPETIPLVYKTSRITFEQQGEAGAGNVSTEFETIEEIRAAVARRLVSVAQGVLRAKAESFSLMDTAQSVNSELLEALRVVSAITEEAPS